jgi:hypothetical protein
VNKDWLDIGILEDYLDGKLDTKTMNRVEREALEDPFVAEALAGLSESPKRSLQSISLLQKQLHERIAEHQSVKKTSVITWQRLSIAATAAVLFIAVSVMFWMRENQHQKELAGRPKKVEVTIAPAGPVAPSAVEAAPVIAAETADGPKEKEISKAIKAAKTNAYAANVKTRSSVAQPASAPQQLNEVAVAGYGVQQKKDITGAVSTVKAKDVSSVWSGKVVAEDDGKPLPGVSVRVEGTNVTAVTDANGEFKLNADTSVKAGLLRADYIGFKRAETLAKVNQPLNLALKADNTQLNEMVVVGYGAVRKKELAVDSNSLSTAVAGKVAGVRIRGMSTVAKKAVMVSNPVEGWDKLFEYINSNNAFAKEKKAGQTVELSFMIDKEGRPADIKIAKGADDKYEQEAIRLITNGPKWEKPLNPKSRMSFKLDF